MSNDVRNSSFHEGEGQRQALYCLGLHGIVRRYRFVGCPSDQLWVPHSGFLTCHQRCRCFGQHVEGVYQREKMVEQVQPWVPHGGCHDHCRPTHFAGEETCVGFQAGNQPRVPRVDYPSHCLQGECVSGYRHGEGFHQVMGDQLAYCPMLQLTYPKRCYFPTSFLKGWRPDIVWH